MLTLNEVKDAIALTDTEKKVQAVATLMRKASEDLLAMIDDLDYEPMDDGSVVINHPEGFQLFLDIFEDDDLSYECAVYFDGTFLRGGFTLLNESDADKLDSLFC